MNDNHFGDIFPVNVARRCFGRFLVVRPKQQPLIFRQVEGIDTFAVTAVFMRVAGNEFRHICGGGQFQQARVEFLGVLRPQSLHGLPSFPAQHLLVLFQFGVQFLPAGGKPCHFGRVKSEFHVLQSLLGDGGEYTKISSRYPRPLTSVSNRPSSPPATGHSRGLENALVFRFIGAAFLNRLVAGAQGGGGHKKPPGGAGRLGSY
ncbi:MAG: hypothetical protein OXU96_05195 [Gammaproteobacteria bacterium]|nr:hypothetical protein [Gammaproteobacteria bacterium]